MGRRERKKDASRQKIGQIVIGLFLVLLMVLSVVQYSAHSGVNELSYNGHDFRVDQQGFYSKIDGTEYLFHYAPLEGDDLQLIMQNNFGDITFVYADPGVSTLIEEASLIGTTFDPTVGQPDIQYIELARFELTRVLGNVVGGVLANSTAYPTLTILDCADAQQFPVVKFLTTNETPGNVSLHLNGTCITVLGDGPSIVAAKDYLLLSGLGVMHG